MKILNPIKKAISALWAQLTKNRSVILLWKPTFITQVVNESRKRNTRR